MLNRKMTERQFVNLEELPISEWVSLVSEGKPEYQKKNRSRHDIRDEYLPSRK